MTGSTPFMNVSIPTTIYHWLATAIALVAVKLVVNKALSIRRAFASIKHYPGRVPLWVDPFNVVLYMIISNIFPRPGMGGYYAAKFSLYEKFGASTLASVDISRARPVFWLAHPDALKIVASDRHIFKKDVVVWEIFRFCGENLLSLEGPNWKRHRSIAMSAFNEENIALVWSEALRIVDKWLVLLDAAGPIVAVDLSSPIEQITLLVIAHACFGGRVSWTDDPTVPLPPGHRLTFRSAFMESVHNNDFRLFAPDWLYRLLLLIKIPYLSSRALRTRVAFDELRAHMLDLVASARSEITSPEGEEILGAALLRNLVRANMSQEGDAKTLSEGELLSNVFIFLFAGQETTAHSLCFAMVLLALHPDCQKKIYEEVTRVWPSDMSFAQLSTNHKVYMDKLEYTMACIRETLRLFPPVPRTPRDVHMDTVLPGTHFTPGSEKSPSVETGKFTMAIPAGSVAVIDIWGLHHNSIHWGKDASVYKPERFLDTESYRWPRNAFMPFLVSPRSCIGQRFALAEMIAVIASVVRQYEIRVPDDLVKESWEVQKEMLLKWSAGVTLTPTNARVKLCVRRPRFADT